MAVPFDNIIVVENLPIVDSAKEGKLLNVITKLFSTCGTIKEMVMPMSGKSKGFMFVHFSTAEEAQSAALKFNNHRMDKSHILNINLFETIGEILGMPDVYVAPETKTTPLYLKQWLDDRKCRDQFVIRKSDHESTLYWHNKKQQPEKVTSKMHWSDGMMKWSNDGCYLATVSSQGVTVWSTDFANGTELNHPDVDWIDWDHNSKYLVSFSKKAFKSYNYCIWDITSGELLKTFVAVEGEKPNEVNTIFKWSFDDKYVARMKAGLLAVYDTSTMSLLEKKSMKIEDLQAFEWAKNSNLISYVTGKGNSTPCRVTLIDALTRQVIRSKNYFGATDVRLEWQPLGEYMLVIVTRMKSKTVTITSFEVFRMMEKDIPVDVVEMKPNEKIQKVFWERSGSKFGMVVDDAVNLVYFFDVQKVALGDNVAAGVKQLSSFEAKGVNTIRWSPKGRFCVLAGLRGASPELQFWDTEDFTLFNTGEHYNCSDIQWDPTGRFVVSTVTSYYAANDLGLIIWSMGGINLNKENIAGLSQFCWRPRPASLLPLAQQKKIRKNLKDYSKVFELEDAARSNKALMEIDDKRKAQLLDYRQTMLRFEELKIAQKEKRIEVLGYDPYESK